MCLEEIFNKYKDSFVFNPLDKTINFTKRRATDYKLNRNVMLPGPLDNDKELEFELRRSGYMKAFDDYQEEESMQEHMDSNIRAVLRKEKKKKHIHKRKKKERRDPLNLKSSEIKLSRT